MISLKEYYWKRHLHRFVKKRKEEHTTLYTFDNINSLCVFMTYETEKKWEEMKQCAQVIGKKEKRIMLLCYSPFKNIPVQEEKGMDMPTVYPLSPKDIHCLGQLKKAEVKQLFTQYYDMFIDMDIQSDGYSLYLKTLVKAGFRIGRNKDYYPYYDLTLCADETYTIEDYIRTLDRYTSKLKGN